MAVIGFELIRERWRKSGRVGYWLWGWRAVDEMQDRSRWEKRTLENDGARRNNFAILLPRRIELSKSEIRGQNRVELQNQLQNPFST